MSYLNEMRYGGDMLFVSYLKSPYDRSLFKPILYNEISHSINKCYYGLWASPVGSDDGWLDWCHRSRFHIGSNAFTFKLRDGAKIYVIDGFDDLDYVSRIRTRYGFRVIDFGWLLKNGYDGIYVSSEALGALRYCGCDVQDLGTWDVESICIFNPDVIIPVSNDVVEHPDYNDEEYDIWDKLDDRLNEIIHRVLKEAYDRPTEEEYNYALEHLYDGDGMYAYLSDIIDRYEEDDRLYDRLDKLSMRQKSDNVSRDSEFICTNGRLIRLNSHGSVRDAGLDVGDLIDRGFIRVVGGQYSDCVCIEIARCPNRKQEDVLSRYISTCRGDVYVDITSNRKTVKHFEFDRRTFSVEMIFKFIKGFFLK